MITFDDDEEIDENDFLEKIMSNFMNIFNENNITGEVPRIISEGVEDDIIEKLEILNENDFY